MNEEYLERMLKLTSDAGRMAMRYFKDSKPALKKDNSIVTKADKMIAQLSHESLAGLIKTKDHILIEEEDPNVSQYLNQRDLEKVPFIWSIDPIDGTRNYANQMPTFAVSIGLLKDLHPWMGAVYFPVLKELLYSDGKNAYFVENAFSKDQKKEKITPFDQPITNQSVFFTIDSFYRRFDWDFKDCHIEMQGCAAVDFCWSALGRACGAFFKSSLWDFAGSWPICRVAGLDLRAFASGKLFDRIDINYFDSEK